MNKSLVLVVALIITFVAPFAFGGGMNVNSIPDGKKLKADIDKQFQALKKEINLDKKQVSQLETLQKKVEKFIDKYDKQIQSKKKLYVKATNGDMGAMQKLLKEKSKIMKIMAEVQKLENETYKEFRKILTADQEEKFGGYMVNKLLLEKKKLRLSPDQQAEVRKKCDKIAEDIGPEKLLSENPEIRKRAQKKAERKLIPFLRNLKGNNKPAKASNANKKSTNDSDPAGLKSPSKAKSIVRKAVFKEFKAAKLTAAQKQKIAVMVAKEFRARSTKVSQDEIDSAIEAVTDQAAKLLTDKQKQKLEG